jgi:hypothetical protein
MPHVFISYVREDSASVDRLTNDLVSHGVNVWLDRVSIKPGERWDLAIKQAIRSGDFFVACFSPNSVNKSRSGMNQELSLAVEELTLRPLDRRWFIPVLLDECEIPEYSIGGLATLRSIQQVKLFSNWSLGIDQVLNVVAPNPRRLMSKEQAREEKVRELLRFRRDDESTLRAKISAFGLEAVRPIIELFKQPPAWLSRNDFTLLIECLGDIGPAAKAAVPQILEHLGDSDCPPGVAQALGNIGDRRCLGYLRNVRKRYVGSNNEANVLKAIDEIAKSCGLERMIEQYLTWARIEQDIISNADYEGEDLCKLFPYRELDDLRAFDPAPTAYLERQVSSENPIRRMRSAAALASLVNVTTVEYESVMEDGLRLDSDCQIDGLLGLRCFPQIQSRSCLDQILNLATSNKAELRLLALKVLLGNCQRDDGIARAIEARTRDEVGTISLLATGYRQVKPLWEEVYYYWSP